MSRTPHVFNHAFVEALVPLYVPVHQNDFSIKIVFQKILRERDSGHTGNGAISTQQNIPLFPRVRHPVPRSKGPCRQRSRS